MSLKEGYHRPNQLVFKAPVKEKKSVVVNGIDLLENIPPRTENEVCGEVMMSKINSLKLNSIGRYEPTYRFQYNLYFP